MIHQSDEAALPKPCTLVNSQAFGLGLFQRRLAGLSVQPMAFGDQPKKSKADGPWQQGGHGWDQHQFDQVPAFCAQALPCERSHFQWCGNLTKPGVKLGYKNLNRTQFFHSS